MSTHDLLKEAPLRWGAAHTNAQTQYDSRKEALLECAASWFHRHGFHGTSLTNISTELGVTTPAIYHYARNKMELLYLLHVRSLEACKVARDMAVKEGSDGMDRVARLVHNFVLTMTGSITCTFILLEPGTLDEERTKTVVNARQWLEYDLRDLIRAGIADGSIVPCDPKLVTLFIVGAQNWIRSWYRSGSEWTGDQIAQSYSIMVRRLLAARGVVELPTDVMQIQAMALNQRGSIQ